MYKTLSSFANTFLLRYELKPIEEESEEIGSFPGDFFIYKTSWASKYTVSENVASFKKLYTFLYKKGSISKHDLNWMKEIIKEEKERWMEEAESY